MNFYYGMVDEANKSWGFVEETDNRAWQDAAHTELKPTMIFLTNEEWQAVLSEQSKGKAIVGYGGKCFGAEQGRYYTDENGVWCKKTDEEFNTEKANAKREELVNTIYQIKADKAYKGVIINDVLVFETNQTAITNTVASLALMPAEGTASWKFYTVAGEPKVQEITKEQLAGIASFGQDMINKCFVVEGQANEQLKAAKTEQLIDSEWVEKFTAQVQAAMNEINNHITVAFS